MEQTRLPMGGYAKGKQTLVCDGGVTAEFDTLVNSS